MAVNITTDTNTVKVIAATTNNVTVVDNRNNTSVSVSQPTTRVIKVATIGPQGPPGSGGGTGAGFPYTGSAQITGSLGIEGPAVFSGSVTSTQGFTGSLEGIASFALTASNITPAITNSSDNCILTDNGDGTITGERNLTFDGTLRVTGQLSQGDGSAEARGDYSHAEGNLATASGDYSHAEGDNTQAKGNYSHAEGQEAISSGSYSHAEGYNTKALGQWSHAEGYGTTATVDHSHAEGRYTNALGGASHAEGILTIAIGEYSHAEGGGTQAIGQSSHAEGLQSQAIGDNSHAEGYGTYTGTNFAFYSSNIASGVITLDSGYGDVTGIFVAGNPIVFSDAPYDDNYGITTFIIDSVTRNSSNTIITLTDTSVTTSEAFCGDVKLVTTWSGYGGDRSIAPLYAHTEGEYTNAFGNSSHAEGASTVAGGTNSHAEGYQTTAGGNNSHAEGRGTLSIGGGSHAEGYITIASGDYSHAQGSYTIATGEGSHAEGAYTLSTGIGSHAEGNSTTASGAYSHAEGISTTAQGNFSHAEGTITIASGLFSHAEGANTTASGDCSHAEGDSTQALGSFSHAEGFNTVALGLYQHVQGQYNISSSAQSAFIIGNGTAVDARSNLVFASGSQVEITGSFKSTGSSNFVGSQIVTGSTRGNVTTLSISSNTASLNLSVGNFFTLQLVQGTNTYINPSNILPGQTSILAISTTGSATVSFPSSVKQPSGSAYIPTTTTGIDIITLASVNTSSLYVVNIKNMI